MFSLFSKVLSTSGLINPTSILGGGVTICFEVCTIP
jgi:hypothetical protein